MPEERAKLNSRQGILICGSYGHGNAGDEAILEAIIASFRKKDALLPITVLSRSPEETAKHHGVDSIYKFNMPAVLGAMRRSKLFLSGGGSLIQDVTSSRSLYYYLFTIAAAKLLGCKVIMYGCGIGPVSKKFNRALSRMVINRFADSITLREDDSLHELGSFGVSMPLVQVSSDPALTLEKASNEDTDAAMLQLGLDPKGEYLCIVPRKWQGFEEKAEAFAKCADEIYETMGLQTLFLSIDHKNDAVAARMIEKYMSSPCIIAPDVLPPHLTIGLLSRMKGVISMRLHGLIFAAGQGVPLIGISYDPKVRAFLHYIGESGCIDLDKLTGEKLIAETKKALELSGSERLGRIQRLRELESINLSEAFRLLQEQEETHG